MSDRYFPNPNHGHLPVLTTEDAYSEFLLSVERILTDYPPSISDRQISLNGFYAGPTSISFLFLALSSLFPNLTIKSKPLRDWCRAYLDISLSYEQRDPEPANCGIANEKLCTIALVAVLNHDESAVQKLCSYVPNLVAQNEERSYEWLYGLSGLLYLLRLCRSVLPETTSYIEPAIQDITACILNHPPPWTWYGEEYLGAAHGTIGILTQVVLSSSSPDLLNKTSPLLSNVLATQLPSGNFPCSPTYSSEDVLIQFCHGAPGFLTSLRSLIPYFPDLRQQLISAIKHSEKCVIERGVLTKSPSLCHGVYGNSLSLGKPDMLKFLKLTCQGGLDWDGDDDTDEKFGLYTGEAGRSWVMAIAATGGESKVLGYNDL